VVETSKTKKNQLLLRARPYVSYLASMIIAIETKTKKDQLLLIRRRTESCGNVLLNIFGAVGGA
jgi:hypothetical protein